MATTEDSKLTGQQIVSLLIAGQCRWVLYTDAQLFDALRYCARMDLNGPIHQVAAALNAHGVLPERDKFLVKG
ncbi:MAG: hypothetical protein WA708_13830 [Acidobacteriaceae bacterium]